MGVEIIQSVSFKMDDNGNSRRVYLCLRNGKLVQLSSQEYYHEVGEDGTHIMPEVFLSRGTYAGMKYGQLANLPWRKDMVK